MNLAAKGDNKSAIGLMRESLSLEPLTEQTHRKIMRLYVPDGERAMALAQFKICKEVVSHELDASPDPEIQALADTIALRDASVLADLRQAQPPDNAVNMATQIKDRTTSVAVLPFVNMSGGAQQNYFTDGMTEDIIVDLSDIDELSVAAKNSSELYRGATVLSAQVAEELGVRFLLQGSVRKSENTARISALLTDTQSNRQVWAERYDRTLDNIFELQSEISKAIVTALKINLHLSAQEHPSQRTIANSEAYQFYLRGKNLRRRSTLKNNELAQNMFERAVASDPNMGKRKLLSLFAGPRWHGSATLKTPPLKEALAKAQRHCDIALKTSPKLAEAVLAQAYILQYCGHDPAFFLCGYNTVARFCATFVSRCIWCKSQTDTLF